MPKLTFSLDEGTVETLRQVAARTRKPQSFVVREAIAQYAACEPHLSEGDREHLLGVLRRIKTDPPTRPAAEVDRELREIRRTPSYGVVTGEPMIVHLDTSVLVDALTGPRRAFDALEQTVFDGHVIAVSTLALYEWLRGPRTPVELDHQEMLLPAPDARAFGAAEAALAASLYRALRRSRGRDMDLAIAACALAHGARLWTLNKADFSDIPGLELYDPPRRR